MGSLTGMWKIGSTIPGALRRRLGIDIRALAAMRIGLGVVLLLDLALRARNLGSHYSDYGMLPREALAVYWGALNQLSLHAHSGAVWFQALLFVLAGLLAVALLLGYRTTLATVLSFVLLASLHARNPLVLNAGDSLLRRLLLWGIFLPLGARWSVDAGTGSRAQNRIVSVPSVALLLQVVIVYLVNGLIKLRGDVWLSGDAMQIVFGVDQLTILLGDVIAEYPLLLSVLDRVWLAMLFASIGLVFAVGSLRIVLVTAFVVAHLGMLLTLRIGIFPVISILALLVFLPQPIWDGVETRLDARAIPARGSGVARPLTEALPGEFSLAILPNTVRGIRHLVQVIPAVLLVFMLLWNAAALGFVTLPMDDTGVSPREHRWDMFAPHPLGTDVRYVAPGTLDSGDQVDAWRGGAIDWDRPPDTAWTYPTARWRKALMDLWRPQYADLRPYFGRYLCRRWNDRHAEELSELTVYVVESPVRLEGPTPTRRVELWQGDCPPS